MTRQKIRFLSTSEVRRALPMADAIEAMKDAFVQLSAGEAVVPARAHIGTSEPPGDVLFMPSYVPRDGRMAVKIVSLFSENPAAGLPRIQALVVVIDATNGSALAVMDGTALTAIRTGAASGAATDLLARKDAKVAAIFGAGVQARTQLEAVCTVRDIQQACVFDPDSSQSDTFATEMTERLGIPVGPAESPADALAGADVVCTATVSSDPVFADADLEPGTHINAIGSYKPAVREVPGDTVCRARVVVDHIPAALEEAGDLLIPMGEGLFREADIYAELGEIAAGKKAGRSSPEQVTLFKSVGVAVQDLAAANRLLANAELLGLGTELSL